MVIRKRRQPTPHFKLPPPFQPITGEQAALRTFGVSPYCAMMQVAATDTHDNYLLCRGFDIRIAKFVNYDAADLANNPGIPVAKPYACRQTGVYEVGQIYAAFLPLQTGAPSPASVPWRVGQNPGVAAVTTGQPADLTETVEILYTDDGQVINWSLVECVQNLNGIALLYSQSCFYPGDSDTFDLYEWDGANWVDSGVDVTAEDENHSVFLLPNEPVWAVVSPGDRYSLIGDVGLTQIGKCDAGIAAGASGTVSIHYHTGTGCVRGDSGCNVTACNDWGYTHDLDADEEVHLHYIRRAWVIIPTPDPTEPVTVKEALATLEQDMCPDDATGAVENVEMLDSIVASPTDADNLFKLAGKAGAWVKLKYRPSTETWFIEQVEHVMRTIALEDPQTETFIKYSSEKEVCEIDGFVLEKTSVMSCEDPEWKIQIPMFSRSYIANLRYENCAIQGDFQGFCAFDAAGEESWSTVITLVERTFVKDVSVSLGDCPTLTRTLTTACLFDATDSQEPFNLLVFEEYLVVTGFNDDGECVNAEYQTLCVITADQTVVEEPIICGVDCEGSGSGSGSGEEQQ